MDDSAENQRPSDEELLGLIEYLHHGHQTLTEVVAQQQRFIAGLIEAMKYYPALKSAFDRGLGDADKAAMARMAEAKEAEEAEQRARAVGDTNTDEDARFMSMPNAKVFGG